SSGDSAAADAAPQRTVTVPSSGAAPPPEAAGSEPAYWQQLPDGVRLLHLGASTLRVSLDERRYQLGAPVLLDWVLRSARAIQSYYGRFPVREAELLVHATRGTGVHGGHTDPGLLPRIDIEVGEQASLQDLESNW